MLSKLPKLPKSISDIAISSIISEPSGGLARLMLVQDLSWPLVEIREIALRGDWAVFPPGYGGEPGGFDANVYEFADKEYHELSSWKF